MKKQFYTFLITGLMGLLSFRSNAQVQTNPITLQTVSGPIITTIQEIQSISGTKLSGSNKPCDASPFAGLIVQFRGRMVVGPKVNFPATTVNGVAYPAFSTITGVNVFGRELYVQAGNGSFAGIMIRSNNVNTPTSPNDILDALAGDSVEVEGTVSEFNGHTQVLPSKFTILDQTTLNTPDPIDGNLIEGIAPVLLENAGVLNNANLINNSSTGEQYESMFVELRDLTIVDVSTQSNSPVVRDLTLTTQRIRITLADAQGNRVQIYDRYKAGRLPANNQLDNGSIGGRLLSIPNVGGKFNYVRGMVVNWSNGDCGSYASFDQGYQIHPFYPSHYGIASYNPPLISDLSILPICPKPSENAIISATIQTVDPGVSVSGAKLYFSFDTLNILGFSSVDMTAVGSTWSGTIPSLGFEEGKLVYFYIKASDSRVPSFDNYYPAIPVTVNGIAVGREKPAFFVVHNNGLQIRDVQFTPFSDGISGFNNRLVTLTGIATSTVNDLGRVTLQQEGASEWGGIFLSDNSFLSDVKRGDKITVSGKVAEIRGGNSTFTVLNNLNLSAKPTPIATGIKINPLFIDHNILAGNYSFKKHEKYEGMLATIINPVQDGKLFVVDTNADYNANFSEYRIGVDTTFNLGTLTGVARNTAVVGTRILAGRDPAENTISSQKFPLINNPSSISGGYFPPNVDIIKSNKIKPIFVSKSASFDNITGIIQHSFGPDLPVRVGVMKLLPRDLFDIKGLQIAGVDAVTTLPGFTIPTSTTSAIIKTTLEDADVYIFPNPTQSILNIKVFSKTLILASVYSLLGSEVSPSKTFVGDEAIDLTPLPKGIYILKLTSVKSGDYLVKRIIVE